MGVDSRRPPLPAPTDISSADNTSALGTSDDLATNISQRTEKTHYTIPEDGTPVTITTKKHRDPKKQSSTSLLIEYFEGGQQGQHPTSRPSLRVRVTPSASRKSKHGRDHIQISETNKSGKRSAVRRISIPGGETDYVEYSSGSDVSSTRPPVEVEVLQSQSEVSELGAQSTMSRYIVAPSDISSMPPDTFFDGPTPRLYSPKRRTSATLGEKEKTTTTRDGLRVPTKDDNRSASNERLTQRVMEKLQKDPGVRIRESSSRRKTSTGSERSSRSRSVSKELLIDETRTSKSRTSKHRDDGSLHPSEISTVSSKSALSSTSINNPRLLNAVEDAIKKLILPELKAVKDEQRAMKNRQRFDDVSRSSTSSRRDEERRVSKSSSLPSVAPGKRDIVIEEQDSGHVEGSTRRRSSRRSSRESISEKSYDTTVRDGHGRRRSSGEKKHSKEGLSGGLATGLAAAALAGLGASALRHQSSSSTVDKDRKKRRSKSQSRSRSRSASVSEHRIDRVESERTIRDNIPPLPMQSVLESELTRDSLLSVDTERASSRSSKKSRTSSRELRDVSHGFPHEFKSSSMKQSVHSPLIMTDRSYEPEPKVRSMDVGRQPISSSSGMKSGIAAIGLGAAAAAATAALHHRHSRDHLITPTRDLSPVQSDSSFLHERDDYAEHPRVRSIRSHHSLSSERKGRKSVSPASSPTMQGSKTRHDGLTLERGYEILPEDEYSPAIPQGDDLEQWLAREHEQNDRFRREIDQESYLGTDVDVHRDTMYNDDGFLDGASDAAGADENLRFVGAKAEYIHTPAAVESAVASLQEPSNISVHSSEKSSPRKLDFAAQADPLTFQRGSYTATAGTMPQDSRQRWEAIRDRAMAMTNRLESPAQSESRSIDEEKPIMGATYVPTGDIPEIGVGLDDESEMITNPSIISGRMGEGAGFSSYEPTPHVDHHGDHRTRDAAILGAGAAAAATTVGLGVATHGTPEAKNRQYQPSIEELEDEHADVHHGGDSLSRGFAASPLQHKDEGYISANPAMSPAPHPIPQHQLEDYDNHYDDDLDEEDPFMTQKHLRHESGLSHGMASPLYDSATGKGIDRIQSKDVVALMDHLTVRDAHRNARDTEILVTLVRSAAEMRNNFEEMKRYIAEQDRLIMHNMDRGHENTVQKVLSGPRPQPLGSPRTPRRALSEEGDDVPSKRRNVFRRALKGLSMRSTNDLTKIEDMLMHLLNEVEGLKDSQTYPHTSQPQTQTTSLNSYEHLRAVPDPGYEPEGRAGTNSSPAQSGHLSIPSSRHLNAMHSGYDAHRVSEGHRISTVLEGDEEADDPSSVPRSIRYADEEEQGTPTRRGLDRDITMETPPEQSGQFQSMEPTPKTDKSRSKYKSGSSIFGGMAKISRWSKTTASTIPESIRNSSGKKGRPYSTDSRSGSNMDLEYDYELDDDDRLRSKTSLDDRIRAEMGEIRARSGSPLVPDYEYDDPKYQVHRNSQNLQHPQPRPGPTHRHQSKLENQAINFEHPVTPDADQWGSVPALALNRNRYSAGSSHRLSPVQSDDGDSQHSASEEIARYERYTRAADEGPLVPPKIHASNTDQNYSMYGVPLMNSGMHIASPLEPIEEVRKSLETDRSSIRQEMTPSPHPTAMQSIQRKPTGPREMPRSTSSSSRRRQASGPPDSPGEQQFHPTM